MKNDKSEENILGRSDHRINKVETSESVKIAGSVFYLANRMQMITDLDSGCFCFQTIESHNFLCYLFNCVHGHF